MLPPSIPVYPLRACGLLADKQSFAISRPVISSFCNKQASYFIAEKNGVSERLKDWKISFCDYLKGSRVCRCRSGRVKRELACTLLVQNLQGRRAKK